MNSVSKIIVTDIGGTFVRFGVAEDGQITAIEKYEVMDFETFESALDHYVREAGVPDVKALRIATAGYEDQGVWRFVNVNPWRIDPVRLAAQGWRIECILNDFEAATWGVLGLEAGDVIPLNGAKAGAGQTCCLLGPGTGLGLGYLVRTGHPFVQKTHGGHVPVSCVSAEQWDIVARIASAEGRCLESGIVFETLVSGAGLYRIYQAVCARAGLSVLVSAPEMLLESADMEEVREALRLFHEFLGLFAAQAVVTGHAYGGVYLTGGVLDRLVAAGLFDDRAFKKYFILEGQVSSVKRDLQATPVLYVAKPYLALHGLMEAAHA